jgi:replication factor C subunit 1
MDEYGLDRDDIFENLDEFTLESKPRKMADLDSKVKASFTREYNKGSHKSQALVDEQGVTKTRRRKAVDENGEAENGEGDDGIIDDNGLGDDDGDDDEEEDNPEQILKLFKSSKKGGKGNKKETTVASKGKKK